VAKLENEFLATDKKNSCAFFADCFGKVMLAEIPVPSEKIIQKSGIKGLDTYKSIYGSKIIPFSDITSYAVKNSTLVLTRAGSHYLYVYGKPL
jgi:UDP-N-acetylglucosamine:LPS N-acetylglucosamine transferase